MGSPEAYVGHALVEHEAHGLLLELEAVLPSLPGHEASWGGGCLPRWSGSWGQGQCASRPPRNSGSVNTPRGSSTRAKPSNPTFTRTGRIEAPQPSIPHSHPNIRGPDRVALVVPRGDTTVQEVGASNLSNVDSERECS